MLLSPTAHVGGLMSSGLGATDVGNETAIGGASLAFFEALGKPGAPRFQFEPHMAEAQFLKLLAAQPRVTLVLNATLTGAQVVGAALVSITTAPTQLAEAGDDNTSRAVAAAAASTWAASVFIDASYEGDLIASAGLPVAIGRESTHVYNETGAGRLPESRGSGSHQFKVFVDTVNHTTNATLPMIYTGDPGQPGDGDAKVQAYNFRMCMTQVASNLRPFPRPPGYDPSYWELARRWLVAANVTSFESLGNFVPVGDGKTDTNNNGPISTDFIGGSWTWPAATPAQRLALWNAHYEYTAGFFWFLQHDPAVPAPVQKGALSWGLAADEFVDNGGWPWLVYVREARRLVGEYVFREQDREFNVSKPDSIGLFSYNIDSHHAQRFVQAGQVLNEGDFEKFGGPLGQIPYRSALPARGSLGNVLAAVPLSASHMGYGTLRLEPQFMIIGQSLGVAAMQAVRAGAAVQDVDVPTLQARLRALGQKIDLP